MKQTVFTDIAGHCGLMPTGRSDCGATAALFGPKLWSGSSLICAPDANTGSLCSTAGWNFPNAVAAGGDTTCTIHPDGWATCWGTHPSPVGPVRALALNAEAGQIGHICALRPDGTITCDGDNDYGQASPPPGIFTAVSAGQRHTCGLLADGSARCWGNDDYGQARPPGGTFTAITAGGDHTCGLRSTQLAECWGRNDEGQAQPPLTTYWIIAAGDAFTCGMRMDFRAECWGSNSVGQSSPGSAGGFDAIIAGARHGCIATAGFPSCWGDNNRGQTTLPPFGGGRFRNVAAGREHTCSLDPGLEILCWGNGDAGQTSPFDYNAYFKNMGTAPTNSNRACGLREDGWIRCRNGLANPPPGAFEDLAVGNEHACAVRADGSVACWGSSGALFSPPDRFAELSLSRFSCGLRTNGTVACWGHPSSLEPPQETFTQLAVGNDFGCGLRPNGTVNCWGTPTPPLPFEQGIFRDFQLVGGGYCALRSDRTIYCTRYYPDPPPSGPFVELATSETHACARRPDGSVRCWAGGFASVPTPPADKFRSIVVGTNWDCGIREDGTLACFGSGAVVPPSGQYLSLSMQGAHAVAIRSDNSAVCFGTSRPSSGGAQPCVAPPAGLYKSISTMTTGETCGVLLDGTLTCWRSGSSFSLAGNFESVVLDSDVCALRTDGTVACFDFALGSTYAPGGAFDAIDVFYYRDPERNWYTTVRCGIRPSGTIECWNRTGAP